MSAGNDIVFDVRGRAGFITLNRPAALNALTAPMATAILERLAAWRDDRSVAHVVIRAEGERAFCAGGDIRNLYDWGLAGDPRARDFYRVEYKLNTAIKRFPKPYVALIDGIVMGGGVGISVHGSHRVGTEYVTFAMPETGIGLFPDVGGSFFLPRMRGETGLYLGLTGARLKGDDALHTGVLTHQVKRTDLNALARRLETETDVDRTLAAFAQPPQPAPIVAIEDRIDRHFGAVTVEAVLRSLSADNSEWAARQVEALASKSPTSLKITLRQLLAGRNLDFEAAMRMEFRLVSRILTARDFFEGIRAVIIDKDGAPHWSPSTLVDISDTDIDRYFAPLADELEL